MIPAKTDQGKLRIDLIPPEAIEGMAKGFTVGLVKYEERNWEMGEGLEWGRVYAALQRHLNAWWRKEEYDEEDGVGHLEHALSCLAMLQKYNQNNERYGSNDNRSSL